MSLHLDASYRLGPASAAAIAPLYEFPLRPPATTLAGHREIEALPVHATGRGSAKSFHAVSRRSTARLVSRPWCRSVEAILVCPARRMRLIVVLRRVAMTCGALPVRS